MYDVLPSNLVADNGADPQLVAMYLLGVGFALLMIRILRGPKTKPYEYDSRSDAGKC